MNFPLELPESKKGERTLKGNSAVFVSFSDSLRKVKVDLQAKANLLKCLVFLLFFQSCISNVYVKLVKLYLYIKYGSVYELNAHFEI